ncbi:MAG: hypothetical protein RLZZ628_2846 [Bacteroidota bacterium]|jgi:transcriptional regulator with XRE-family HTH domain
MNSTKKINIVVGNAIRILRESKNISQEELGFRANLHRAYIGQIERAEKNITIQNLDKIAKGLEVMIQELFLIYPEPPRLWLEKNGMPVTLKKTKKLMV